MSERPLFKVNLIPGGFDISPFRDVKNKLDMTDDEWKGLSETSDKITNLIRGDEEIFLDSGWRSPKTETDPVWRIRSQEK